QAQDAATQLGLPVVLKVLSPDIIHKSDVNGVYVNLQTLQQVEDAYERIASETGCGDVLVAAYRSGATELIAGAVHDSVFGPCLMLGAGGIYAEALLDFSIRVLPTNASEITSALQGLRIFPILQGQRGEAGTDIGRLTQMLLSLANLIATEPLIAEMDLNPILVRGNTLEVADARIIVSGS
ncbi:MAG: acetate--CoA ligase family protein, partial [Acidimicrobiia bacterium]